MSTTPTATSTGAREWRRSGVRARLGLAGGIGGAVALLGAGVAGASPAPARPAHATAVASSAQSPVGKVASVDAAKKTFTLTTSSGGTVTVTVTAATSFRVGASSGSFADLKTGDSVAVIGTGTATAVTAATVVVGQVSSGGTGAPSGFGGGPGGFAGGTFGTVSSVDSSKDTFVVKEASGSTVTVKVTKSTTYRDAGSSSGSFSDVKKGDRVAVQGTTSNGKETATSVILLGSGAGGFGPGRLGAGGTFGTVSSVDSSKDTFVVKEASGSTVTVKVTKSTTYRDSSTSSAGFSDVKKGDQVAVQGTTSNGVETATAVILGGGFGRGFAGGTFGTVSSVDSSKDTFVVKEASGSTVTVKVTKSTTYADASSSKPGFSDVKKGATVVVQGTTSNGVETATSVRIGGLRPPAGGTTTTG